MATTEIQVKDVTVLSLKPDDVLVFRIDRSISRSDADQLRADWLTASGLLNKIVILSGGIEISALREVPRA